MRQILHKFNILRLLTMLAAIIATSIGNGAWAESKTESFTFSEMNYANQDNVETVNGDGCTITFDKGTNSNTPKYYTTGTAVRAYGGNTFKVFSDNSITKIVLTFGSGDGSNAITADNGTYEDGTWTGDATNVTFTIGGTSGHRRIASIAVTYTADASDTRAETTTTIDATDITNTNVFNGTAAGQLTATVAAGETTIDNAAITWSGNNDDVATIAADGTVTLAAAGEVTFTATYAGDETNYKGSSATYKLTVINTDPNAPGTENNPYTVAQAVDAIDNDGNVTDVYVAGIVSKVDSYNSKYKSITYWISADGTTNNQFEVYSGKGIDGADFSSKDDIQVGDVVVVKGNITYYERGKIYEFASNNQLVSLVRKLAAPTFSVEAGEYGSAQSVELSAADGATIYYTTDGTEPTAQSTAHTEAIIVSETMTIKAIAVKDNEASDVASATYTISTLPSIDVANTAISVSYSQKQGTLEVTWNNIKQPAAAVKFYEADGTTETTYDWITAEINNSNNVDYVIEANTGDARTAYLKVFDSNSSVSSDLVTITQAKYVKDFAALPFKFLDKGKDKIPTGLKQNGLGNDYKSSPYLKFDTTGDNLILKINERPGVLSFDIKGNSFSGGTFTVQTSEDGETYTDLEAFTELSGDKQNMNFNNLGENVRYIKWVYTSKSSGNVALGNIKLAKYVEPVPTITPESTAIALEATDGEGSISVTYTNFEVSKAEVQFFNEDGTTPATYDWLTADLDGNSISYIYDANTGDERTAYMKIYALDTDANAVYSDLITITQAGKPKADVTLAFSKERITVAGIAEVEEPTLTATSGEAAVDGLAITYSSSDTDVATVDETTGAVTIVAYGTAIITASFAGNDNYNAATATYTIMVENPDKTYYALVAEYNNQFFAVDGSSFNSGAYDAVEVDAVNGKVVSKATNAISFEFTTYTNVEYIKNKQTSKYIGYGSSTNLSQLNASYSWTIDKDHSSWKNGDGGTRSIVYRRKDNIFKAFATSNINDEKGDYATSYTQAYTFADGYVRDVNAGGWGTFCVDHSIALDDYSGVTFYLIGGKIVNAQEEPVAIVLEKANELMAGVAYIFQANEGATKLVAAYCGDSTSEVADASANNGLVGSLNGTAVAKGMYLLSGGKVVKCGTGCNIAANRAYIDMSQVPVVDTSAAGVKLGIGDITVGIDGIQSNGTTGSIYNIAGQRMSKLQRGLNIVDGKKVLVK